MQDRNPFYYDYEAHVQDYASVRKTDPRIKAYVDEALQTMGSVINVGAGTGSYEPSWAYVLAVEPSRKMREERLKAGRSPALNAQAESLPYDQGSFDASLAVLTLHHWADLARGLQELRRVSRRKIVILSFDPDEIQHFWNAEYFPELVRVEQRRYPKLSLIEELVGLPMKLTKVKIPFNCTDGFQEAFYGRPEAFLKEEVRRSQSAWGFLPKDLEAQYCAKLAGELESGEWEQKYGFYRRIPEYEGAFRMLEFEIPLG